MSLVKRLLVVAASFSIVVALDVALTPCYSVHYLKNLTQEFKFDSSLNAASVNLSDCVFTLIGPTTSSLKLFLHDVVEKDPATGVAMTEPLCLDGAVRMYEMTSDGDLYITDAVCHSLVNSTEVNTTYNVVVVTSTITSGTFNLSVTVIPGPIPTAPKDQEVENPITEPPPDNVVEDTTTTSTTTTTTTIATTTTLVNDGDDAVTEVDDEAMGVNVDTSENEVVNNTTVMMDEQTNVDASENEVNNATATMEEESEVYSTTAMMDEETASENNEYSTTAMMEEETDLENNEYSTTAMMEEQTTEANTEEPAMEGGYETTTEEQPPIVTTDDTISVEAADLMESMKDSINNVMKIAKPGVNNVS